MPVSIPRARRRKELYRSHGKSPDDVRWLVPQYPAALAVDRSLIEQYAFQQLRRGYGLPRNRRLGGVVEGHQACRPLHAGKQSL